VNNLKQINAREREEKEGNKSCLLRDESLNDAMEFPDCKEIINVNLLSL
jgi:hypothetical protein